MRLVIATPLYPSDIGGPATYAKLLEEGLPAEGIEVELVKFNDVRHMPKIIRHYIYYRRVLRAAHRADVVLALDPVSVGWPALRAARRAGKPFVVKVVGDYAWEQGQQRFGVTASLDKFIRTQRVPFFVRMLRRVQTHVARGAALIIVPSEYLKGIVTAWGIPASSIRVIYNAVPLKELGTVPEAVARLPKPLVVTAGRLVPWKHIEGIIDAVAAVPGTSLIIIGDGPLRPALAQHAREKLSGRVIMTGTLPHNDTLAIIRFADAFMLNSSYEGLSHLLIEALTLGVPTIATRVGGNPEVIVDGGNGLLVESGDTQALTSALERVFHDTGLATRLQTAAVASAKQFSVETMLKRTVDLLHRL